MKPVIDEQGFSRLYRRFAPRLFRYFWINTRTTALSEDLVGETFLSALQTLGTYRPERGSLTGWLYAIARRILLHYRQAQAGMRVVPSGLAPEVPALSGDQGPSLESQIDLWGAVGELPDPEREVVALKFGAGLTNREIAEVTGRQQGYVGVLLYRALQKLRTHLDVEEGSDAR